MSLPAHTNVPHCERPHHPSDSISRLTLILQRRWTPADIDRLLGAPDVTAAHREFPRDTVPGERDRFCTDRIALAEVGDMTFNTKLPNTLQYARFLILGGAAALIRYGKERWVALARAQDATEGASIEVREPVTAHGHRGRIASIGPAWAGVKLVTFAPSSLQREAGVRPHQPSFHGITQGTDIATYAHRGVPSLRSR